MKCAPELPGVPLKKSVHVGMCGEAGANFISWRGWLGQAEMVGPSSLWSLRASRRLAGRGYITEGYRMAAFLNNFIAATCKYWHFRSKPHLQQRIQPRLLLSTMIPSSFFNDSSGQIFHLKTRYWKRRLHFFFMVVPFRFVFEMVWNIWIITIKLSHFLKPHFDCFCILIKCT